MNSEINKKSLKLKEEEEENKSSRFPVNFGWILIKKESNLGGCCWSCREGCGGGGWNCRNELIDGRRWFILREKRLWGVVSNWLKRKTPHLFNKILEINNINKRMEDTTIQYIRLV